MSKNILFLAFFLAVTNCFAELKSVSAEKLTPEQAFFIFNKQYNKIDSLSREVILKAEEYLKIKSKSAPSSDIYFKIAIIEDLLGNRDESLLYYSKAIELNPSESKYYGNRGLLHLEKGNSSEALIDLNKAIEIAPNMAFVYHKRHLFYVSIGNYEKAKEDLEMFFKLNKDKKFERLAEETDCRNMAIAGHIIKDCPSLEKYTITKGIGLDERKNFIGFAPRSFNMDVNISKTTTPKKECCEWKCTTVLTKCCEEWECTDYSPSTGECLNWKCKKWTDCLIEHCKCEKLCDS
ncbi:MAG: hypothetical protein HY746_06690 [Elusimicrobia bacterium]|nr:hypothetical protein [Elusimicrobiota bacterium]